MNADDILFRCSSTGYLMVEPKGKSNLEQYLDAVALHNKLQKDYAEIKKVDGKGNPMKSAQNKLAAVLKASQSVNELARTKDDITLSETVKTHLIDKFVSAKYERYSDIKAKQFKKGNAVEEDSVTTISRIRKTFLKKNEECLKNEYIIGTPDLYEGESLMTANVIRDAKSSWNAISFFRAKYSPLNPLYYFQVQSYLALSGASEGSVDHCLNNTPYFLVENELRAESYKHLNADTPNWIELQIIANHVYDKKAFDDYILQRGASKDCDENSLSIYQGFVEIPLTERHFANEFERNDNDIDRLYERIKHCRTYMNKTFFTN